MKKFALVLAVLLSAFGVAAESKKSPSVLVVYFSHRGSTKTVGNWIADCADADIFEIEPQKAYPSTYEETLPIARSEQDETMRPLIKKRLQNLESYDVVFIGYPLWFGKMPMILYTFFDEYDFSGKKIVPFVTYGGSPVARGWDEIPQLEPEAQIIGKLAVKNGKVKKSKSTVEKFVKSLNLKDFANQN
ncbi:flavodoxin [Treponema sp.]|uniref:flavodoxin n=1 Tax=Treponema sp. TaxID=166 RepID=UPI003F09E384